MKQNARPSWPEKLLPIVLVGPTATGKTAAAITLAQRLNGEIVNADSMQVYRGMDIGTAKPTWEERQQAVFHLLDLITPDQPFSVSAWKTLAEAAIADIARRGKRPIVCGGTGLYVRALLDDWSLAETPPAPGLREALREELERRGAPALHAQLVKVDPESASRLHPNDSVRILRALEVYRLTGQTISDYQERDKRLATARPAIRLGLTMERLELYARIEARVDTMLDMGFVDEVRRLLDKGYAPTLSPLKSLGYKEIVALLQGELDAATTCATIKQNTRRFAKRQQTWFRPDTRIIWFDVSAMSSATAAERLLTFLTESEREQKLPSPL